MKKDLGIEAELIPGKGGIFDIAEDGEMVFSRHAQKRFPEEKEIVSALLK